MKSYRITYKEFRNWLLTHKKGEIVGEVNTSCGCLVSNYYADRLGLDNTRATGVIASTVPTHTQILDLGRVGHRLDYRMFAHPKYIERLIYRLDRNYKGQGYVRREEALAELAASYELRNVERVVA